jgi:putative ABC transport system ATP-binding protein
MKELIMDDLVVRAAGLSKSYRIGGVTAPVLRDIDLAVARGECLFLVGPSGSGKTTLLSILGCVLSADSGLLQISGADVSSYSSTEQARFRREKVGFVFQRFHLFDALSAVENVQIAFDLLGTPKVQARQKSLDLLSLVGLADKAASRVTQLSMGQRQRVALARALAGDPDLILADEPTASLDAESGYNAMRILKDLCQSLEKTVIVVTHDSRIYSMADRILKIADGRVVEEQSAEQATKNVGSHLSGNIPRRAV